MKNIIKKDGDYDGRTKAGRQANGKTIGSKATEKKMWRALNNKN